MSELRYYYPTGSPNGWFTHDVRAVTGEVFGVGPRELAILLRARNSASHSVIINHGRKNNAERLAARRLVERGLLTRRTLGGGLGTWRETRGAPQYMNVYKLTELGRTCWLRVKQS